MVSVLLWDVKVFGIFYRIKSVELDMTEEEAKYLIDKAKELYTNCEFYVDKVDVTISIQGRPLVSVDDNTTRARIRYAYGNPRFFVVRFEYGVIVDIFEEGGRSSTEYKDYKAPKTMSELKDIEYKIRKL